jgi:DNA-directed RNA polymerase specialized sigma24 family protein
MSYRKLNETLYHLPHAFVRGWKDRRRGSPADIGPGQAIRVTFEKALEVPAARAPDWVVLDGDLNALQAPDPRKSWMAESRFFGGLSVEETAEVLKVSTDTIHRDWRFAKTWLRRELSRAQQP